MVEVRRITCSRARALARMCALTRHTMYSVALIYAGCVLVDDMQRKKKRKQRQKGDATNDLTGKVAKRLLIHITFTIGLISSIM